MSEEEKQAESQTEEAQTDETVEGAEEGSTAESKPYIPEGLPEHFQGKSDQETIDHMFKALEGFRKEQGKKQIPEKPEDYKLDIPKEFEGKIIQPGEDGKDPFWNKMAEIAHKNRIPQPVLSEMALELYKSLADAQENGTPEEQKSLEGLDFGFKEMGGADKARPVQEAVVARAAALKEKGELSDSDLSEIEVLAGYAQGLSLAKKFVERFSEKPIPTDIGGGAGDGKLTEGELHTMMRDPKYWREKDPAFIAKVTDGFKALYG